MTKKLTLAICLAAYATLGICFAQFQGPANVFTSGTNKGKFADPFVVTANSGTGAGQFANGQATEEALASKVSSESFGILPGAVPPPLYSELMPPFQVQRFRDKLRAIDTTQNTTRAVMLALGDSMAHRKPNALMDLLGQRYGIAGYALESFTTLSTEASGTYFIPSASTSGSDDYTAWETGAVYSVSGSNSYITIGLGAGASTTGVASNSLSVYAISENGGGAFKVQYEANGGAWTDLSGGAVDTNNSGARAWTVFTGTFPSTAMHRIRIVATNSGTSKFIGAKLVDANASGVIYARATRGGLRMVDQNLMPQAGLNAVIGDLAPDLIVFEQKDNLIDYTNDLPPLINRWNIAASSAEWCLVGTNQTSGTDDTLAINARVREEALLRNYWYFDGNLAMGGWANIQRLGWASVDPIHLADAAHQYCAAVMAQSSGMLITHLTPQIARNISSGTLAGVTIPWVRQSNAVEWYFPKLASARGEMVIQNNDQTMPQRWGFGMQGSGEATFPNGFTLSSRATVGGATVRRFGMSSAGLMSIGDTPPANTATRALITESSNSRSVIRANHTGTGTSNIAEFQKGGVNQLAVGSDGTIKISGTSSAPSNTSTPVAWRDIEVSGTTYKLPLYQ